jgi:SAM-dependent methyltransferase
METMAPAVAAYEPLAPYYDRFTHESAYESVLTQIEAWARAQGLRGRRLLDVGCGTGNSFQPLLERGYRVTACDISPAMVAEARRKAPKAEVVVADMRELPWRADFDLVTCVDDAVNYLLTEDDLDAAMASMAAALDPDGILLFDTTSLLTYRTEFAEEFEVETGGMRFSWRGEACPKVGSGEIVSMTLTAETPDGPRGSRHVQRHWPVERLRLACERAGFSQVVFRGLAPGPQLAGEPDEELHPKVVCLAARPDSRDPRPAGVREGGSR